MPRRTKSVMVGMSGGVDSTVTALLLQQQGYEVVGVTFRLWSPKEDSATQTQCNAEDNVRDAANVCRQLGISHHVFDYQDKFEKWVVGPFAQQYQSGVTPNPCVDCNRHIKFGEFLRRARGMGFDYIATGHYAQIVYDEQTELYQLKKGVSEKRDQSYFLYSLTQDQLEHTLMPLGGYDKPRVRELASEFGFEIANRPDSQDICFIPHGDYGQFLDEYLDQPGQPGNFVDTQGQVLGTHSGLRNYTIGQRKGLGVSLGKPAYVVDMNVTENQVVLGDDQDLMRTSLQANEERWTQFDRLEKPLKTTAKIRYAAKPTPAVVTPTEDGIKVEFQEDQRAITPGQSVVFYEDDVVVGGATIVK